jgi:HAD superfamily hydrolase (TIGR01509 family)
MRDAVLCELEGVLVDTSRPRAEALRAGLAAAGLTAPLWPAGAELDPARPVADVVRDALSAGGDADETLVDLATLAAESRFAALAGGGALALADGARAFLESALGRVRLAVVTRARRREAEMMLGLAGLADAFEFVIAAEDAATPKPHPAPYERALGRLARRRPVARDRIVALEDGPTGVAAAHAAGLRCVLVGPGAARDVGAEAWLPSLRDVTLDALMSWPSAAAARARLA